MWVNEPSVELHHAEDLSGIAMTRANSLIEREDLWCGEAGETEHPLFDHRDDERRRVTASGFDSPERPSTG
jgi:hypothetical protein